jgi:hypothetical protein
MQDWHNATVVKDARALIKTVRSADGTGDVVNGVRSWLTDYPTKVSTPRARRTSAKPRARKPATNKATSKSLSRKATAKTSTHS